MRRFVLLTYIGVALACFTGCHHWHRKHLYRACYTACDPCGCVDAGYGAYDGVAVPTSQIIPAAPGKLIPLSPASGIPGPPGPAALAPPAPRS
jgi:hypothetical protein